MTQQIKIPEQAKRLIIMYLAEHSVPKLIANKKETIKCGK